MENMQFRKDELDVALYLIEIEITIREVIGNVLN